MQSLDKKTRSWIWRKLAWINLNAKIADLWTSTWVARLGSLSQGSGQGGSSYGRECYCKKLHGQIRHWKSDEVQHPCGTWNNSQKICQRWWGFSHMWNICYIVPMWWRTRECIKCSVYDQIHTAHNLARHMTHVMKVHFEAMLRMMMKCSKFDEKVEWEQGPLVCH